MGSTVLVSSFMENSNKQKKDDIPRVDFKSSCIEIFVGRFVGTHVKGQCMCYQMLKVFFFAAVASASLPVCTE